jgi:hypothetical protein
MKVSPLALLLSYEDVVKHLKDTQVGGRNLAGAFGSNERSLQPEKSLGLIRLEVPVHPSFSKIVHSPFRIENELGVVKVPAEHASAGLAPPSVNHAQDFEPFGKPC